MSLQIEYLAPLIATEWPQSLHFHFVLVMVLISRRIIFLTFSLLSEWMLCVCVCCCFFVVVFFPHNLLQFQGGSFTPADSGALIFIYYFTSTVCLHPEVFTDLYQCLSVITPAATAAISPEVDFVCLPAELIYLCL